MWRAALLTVLLVAAGPGWGADPDLARAEALVKAGKPAEAYELLAPFESQMAGDLRFDYLLGIAALDSGRADLATLAFERVLAVDPAFGGARLDMARAYFQLGDHARAKSEFQAVLALNPPAAARATAENYLKNIEEREKAKRLRGSAYLETGAGRDSNVNSSTSQSQIEVPYFGNAIFTLNPSNVATADRYASGAAGGEFSAELSRQVSLYGGVDWRKRNYGTQDLFDSTSTDGRFGIAVGAERHLFRVGATGGRYALHGQTNRNTRGGIAEWAYLFSPANRLHVQAQQTTHVFPDPALKVNDFKQTLYGLGMLHPRPDGRTLFAANLLGGGEVAEQRADGGKKLRGGRLATQVALTASSELFLSYGAMRSTYEKKNIAFDRTRAETQVDTTLGLTWHPARDWSLRPQVTWIRNTSNVVLYRFSRRDASLNLRWDLR